MAAKRTAKQQPRLTPGAIAEELFCLDPDRDERAPQLCAETLLTLVQNGYRAPEAGQLVTPKRQLFALRSLAMGENFLGGRDDGRVGDDETTPAEYGASLAAGRDMRSSSHLELAHQTLQGLVDPETQRGSQPARTYYGPSTSRCCGTTPARRAPRAANIPFARSTCAAAASLSPGYWPTRRPAQPSSVAPLSPRSARHSPATAHLPRSAADWRASCPPTPSTTGRPTSRQTSRLHGTEVPTRSSLI